MIEEADGPDRSAEAREGLTIERYAEVMAHIRHFPRGQGAEVVARLGLTGRQWESAVQAWTDALAEESALEEEALSRSFGMAFAETKARLRKEQPPLASIGLLPEPRAAAEAPRPSAIGAALPTMLEPTAPPVDLPSYMLASVAPTPPLAAQDAVDALSIVPIGMRGFRSITGTEQPAVHDPGQPLLPFRAPSRTAPPPASTHVEKTTELQPKGPLVDGSQALSSTGTGSLSSSSAKANVPPVPIVPEGMRGFKDLHSTQLATGAPKGPALPFEPSRPMGSMPAHANAKLGEPPPLSLEQYASLCVELADAPARRPEVLRRYRISEEQHRRTEAYWQAQITADATVSLAWDRACAAYRAWLNLGGQSSAPPGQSAPVVDRSDPPPIATRAAQSPSGRDLRETSAPGDQPKPEFSVSTGEVMLPLKAVLPFENAPPVPRTSRSSGKFEIEQYAALCAELATYPEHPIVVRIRHGIEDDAALQRIHRQFEDQFRADPDLRDRWIRLRTAWVAGLPRATGR